MWTYSRIDRVEIGVVHCTFCNRALGSGRVTVIVDEGGLEAFVGPACARKHLGPKQEALLDLSAIAMRVITKPENTSPSVDPGMERKQSRGPGIPHTAPEQDNVLRYLQLRVEHMAGFTGSSIDKLRECHARALEPGGLPDEMRAFVTRLMSNSSNGNTIYALRNVEQCIGMAYWLKVAIKVTKVERRDFLEAILKSLHEKWRLSDKQIHGINRWGDSIRKSITDFPTLDASTFDGVVRPGTSAAQNSGS